MIDPLRLLWDRMFNTQPTKTESLLSREDILVALHRGQTVACFITDTQPPKLCIVKRDGFTGAITAVTKEGDKYEDHLGSDWLVDNFMLKYAPAEKWEVW